MDRRFSNFEDSESAADITDNVARGFSLGKFFAHALSSLFVSIVNWSVI